MYGRGCVDVDKELPLPYDEDDGRLPTSLSPYHYDLEIRAAVEGAPPFEFDGWVDAWFEAHEAVDVIYMNSGDLDINIDDLNIILDPDSPVQVFSHLH